MKLKHCIFVLMAMLSSAMFLSCTDSDSEDNNTGDEPIEVLAPDEVDESFVPNEAFMQKAWAGEYAGWDDVQKKNTKIKRILTLNADRSYTNVIQGILVESGKDDYVDFEREKGYYTYNARTGVITYSVTSDSIIQYKDQSFIGYGMKKYYDHQSGTYTEEAKFTPITNGGRKWVTKDTYLQSLTAKELDLAFSMDAYSAK